MYSFIDAGTRAILRLSSISKFPAPFHRAHEMEGIFYYTNLPSRPKLISRTDNTQWKPPTGPEVYAVIRKLRAIALLDARKQSSSQAPNVHDLLDLIKVKWTSADVVRIGNTEESFSAVILWIDVMPASLWLRGGSQCRKLLKNMISRTWKSRSASLVVPLGPVRS